MRTTVTDTETLTAAAAAAPQLLDAAACVLTLVRIRTNEHVKLLLAAVHF